MQYQRLDSSNENVFKYIFDWGDALTEAVLYKYPDFETRTVLCISVQSGCPVGCTFCGTGKHFVRNLTAEEIVEQVAIVLKDKNIEDVNSRSAKFQLMFMSMGEPMLNWDNVEKAIKELNRKYANAALLLSTVGIDNDDVKKRIIELSMYIEKVGLQFSIHKLFDADRDKLIPYKNKMNLRQIRDFGIQWWLATGRNPFLNICVSEEDPIADCIHFYQETEDVGPIKWYKQAEYGSRELNRLFDLFSPEVFCLTFSVICSADKTMANTYSNNIDMLNSLANLTLKAGYNTRVFNPAGQDDIGGGCGQLWAFQNWFKAQKERAA